MKITLVLLVLLAGATLFASQVDDRLSPEAQELIRRLSDGGESEAYLFLLGIDAHRDDNPADVGRNLLAEFRQQEANAGYEIMAYDAARKIPLPTGDLFCSAWKDGCLEHLFSSTFGVDEIINEHQVLMERLSMFHQFDEYASSSKPTINEMIPPYQYVSTAERLRVLVAISTYKNGSTYAAINSLEKQLAEMRKSMELQDSLIGKLVFLMKFSEVVDVLSIVHLQSGEQAAFIPLLTAAETDFSQVVTREFGMVYHHLMELDRHPSFLHEIISMPGWLVRVLYKPNMSINAMAPVYTEAEYLMRRTPAEFANYLQTRARYIPSTSRLRNYVGRPLISMPLEFDQYIARFKDVDTKLTLFNQRYHHQADLNAAKNPFYPERVPEISPGKACFQGRLEDTRYLRCIRI